MTHSRVPGLAPNQEDLFGTAAGDCARYRPGVPKAAVRLLADALRDRPDPVLLDLGTGTRQVPLALQHVVPALAHIEAVDISRRMLDRARDALTPVLGRCTLTLVPTAADAYRPPAPLPGRTDQASRTARQTGARALRHVRKKTWQEHYDAGLGFRPLSDAEQALLAEHVPAPESGRALDVGSGTGELAVVLARMGYHVDAVDFTEGALVRARAEHPGVQGVRWLCLDIEHDVLPSPPEGSEGGYDLVTMRLSAAFIQSRSRVLRALGAQLREGGALVVITPVVEHTPQERRHIALDKDELSQVTDGFEEASRFDVEGLAVLVLRGPGGSFTAVEKGWPAPQAVMGAAAVVTNAAGHVLLGRSTRGMWELPGGRIEAGESVQAAAVRELEEETGLTASEENAHIIAVLHDDRLDMRRISPVVRVTCWEGEPGLPEPEKFSRWEWHPPHTLATLGRIFMPSAQALNAVWPGTLPGLPPVHSYPCATAIPYMKPDEETMSASPHPPGPGRSTTGCAGTA
ncbi:NUDIX domain-containing protein [Streptomyces sp. NPDC056053]|uniref:NUDIX domain-containing protein n=1 Tax=Streptomyces sp. NPDC056053 TaxID=3345696 RepID=UPI0035E23D8D